MPDPTHHPNRRKAITAVLLLGLTFSQPLLPGLTSPQPAFAVEAPAILPVSFSDIQGHWAAPAITELASRRIIHGFADGTFRPDQPLTRAEFLSLIIRITGLNLDNIRFIKAPDPRDTAPDVSPDVWYAQDVITAGTLGVLPGGQPFRPDEPIRREEMAQLAVNALNAKVGPIVLTEQFILFKDGEAIDSGYMGALQDAYKLRIMQGYGGYIRPRDQTTRAEGITVLHNLDQAIRSRTDNPPRQ